MSRGGARGVRNAGIWGDGADCTDSSVAHPPVHPLQTREPKARTENHNRRDRRTNRFYAHTHRHHCTPFFTRDGFRLLLLLLLFWLSRLRSRGLGTFERRAVPSDGIVSTRGVMQRDSNRYFVSVGSNDLFDGEMDGCAIGSSCQCWIGNWVTGRSSYTSPSSVPPSLCRACTINNSNSSSRASALGVCVKCHTMVHPLSASRDLSASH